MLVEKDPKNAVETFTVVGFYGDTDPEHDALELRRTGGLGDVDEVGVLAYENLLIALVRCVGSDYVEYAGTAGVQVDSVRIEVEGTIDLRGAYQPFGIEVPADAKPGWKSLRVRAEVETASPRAAAEKAHRVVWDHNIAAASLASVPTEHEVTIKAAAPAESPRRGERPQRPATRRAMESSQDTDA